jgi:predicted O-methyltransferase YrrM
MSREQWAQVDEYIHGLLIENDPVLDAALQTSKAAGLPSIAVAANQGKWLQLTARALSARTILEIGTLGGYSSIWLGRALPKDGRLISLEIDPKHAEVARANIARAGLSERVEVRLGAALESLPRLAAEDRGPFDFIFIDADKENIPEYFTWALELSRSGTVIVVDNVIWRGAVVDANSGDSAVQGVRRFNELLAREKRVSATEIQTVGSKGYDGFAFVLVG